MLSGMFSNVNANKERADKGDYFQEAMGYPTTRDNGGYGRNTNNGTGSSSINYDFN